MSKKSATFAARLKKHEKPPEPNHSTLSLNITLIGKIIMTNAQRMIVNIIAQYTRTILNVCLSLYSTRLILSVLGQSDYGIYSLVAGVVAMLSFVTNALVTTTQRYLSFSHGRHNMEQVYAIFGNSMLLHIVIGVALSIVLSAIGPIIVGHFLNIASERQSAALVVYCAAVMMLMLSFITAPIRALFVARENIVYISVVDVLDGILKLVFAVWLSYITFDHLVCYAGMMSLVSFFNLLAFGIFAFCKFPECHWPRLHEWNRNYMKELGGFASWTIYSTGCIITRTQGVAVLLNLFVGTMANAAFGIAQQVSGAVGFVSQSVCNAINPQIMKAEGAGDRHRMLRLAEYESKYAFLLLAMVVVPLVAEMNDVLQLWLGDIPVYAVAFCRYILIAALCDQITIGLGSANQAIGQIRNYSLVINTIKVLTLPAAWLCLKIGCDLKSVFICYVLFEIMCSVLRIPFLHRTAGLNMVKFVRHTYGCCICPFLVMIGIGYVFVRYIDLPYRFLLTTTVVVFVGGVVIWLTALSYDERRLFLAFIRKKG